MHNFLVLLLIIVGAIAFHGRADAACPSPLSVQTTASGQTNYGVSADGSGNCVPNETVYSHSGVGGTLTSVPLVSCNNVAQGSDSTIGLTSIVTGQNNQAIYICGFDFVVGTTAVSPQLEYGSGSNCATGPTAVTPVYPLPAGANFSDHTAFWSGLQVPSMATGQSLCLNLSSANNVAYTVYYAQYGSGP